MNISKNWLQTFPHSGVVFCYQPQKCTLKGKSLKIPIHLHCLIPPPQKKKMGHYIIPDILLFFCLFPSRDFLENLAPPKIRAIFLDFTKIVAGFFSINQSEGKSLVTFFWKFPRPKNDKGSQLWGLSRMLVSYGDFLYGSSSPFESRWLEIDIASLISLRHSGD